MKKTLVLALALLLFSPGVLSAEKFESPEYGFSINPSAEWQIIPQNFQGGLVSYYKTGSSALFHVTTRDMEEAKSTDELKWEDLFHPQFDSIAIGTDGETTIGGQKAKYCTYRIKPGPFKTQMEGKVPAKYINYVILYGGRLFSVTFVDTVDHFSLDYSSFLQAVRTVNFTKPVMKEPESAEDVEKLIIRSKVAPETVEA